MCRKDKARGPARDEAEAKGKAMIRTLKFIGGALDRGEDFVIFWLNRMLRHFEDRIFELATTLMMLGLALLIAIWPASIGASAFRYMLLVMSPAAVAIVFFTLGTARIAALIANGHWPIYGPFVRAAGALFGALMWLQMDLALINLMPNAGTPPSPGIPVYFFLFAFELVSMYRALAGRHGYRNPNR